jgi:DNA-binding NtrC family response regulator
LESRDILIIEEDGAMLRDLKTKLSPHGYRITIAQNRATSLRLFQARKPGLVIIGVFKDNSLNGLEVVEEIRAFDRKIPIILIAKNSSEKHAIAALKAGVNDYFKEPVSYSSLITSIKQNLIDLTGPSPWDLQKDSTDSILCPTIIGHSISMRKIKAQILKLAKADSTVLITGETGTGKELATGAIHQNSSRFKKPLVCINCAAIPENLVESELFGHERGAFTGAVSARAGMLESANGGTVFLDEIGDMNPQTQAKILRTIEMKEAYRLGGRRGKILDFRVIAATNREPERLAAKGRFRKDLYYRLNVARVHLPPLRERKEDIPDLIEHYISIYNQHFGRNVKRLTRGAMEVLSMHDWPGNVRELKNLIEVSFINLPTKRVDFMDIPDQLKVRIDELKTLPKSERDRVITALCATNWNKSKAAQKLNWSRMTLYRKIAKYNIFSERVEARQK